MAILEQGTFQAYSNVRLDQSRSEIRQFSEYGTRKTTVFISHSHEDLEDLKGVLGFLERTYGVMVYIDSQDPYMPKTTSSQTATNIKSRIKTCDKFLLLATHNAVCSKWCNWELGFGDSNKYIDHIAILPMKQKGASDSSYKGSEYMRIYPYIQYSNGTEKYTSGQCIPKGYYVVTEKNNKRYYKALESWFANR